MSTAPETSREQSKECVVEQPQREQIIRKVALHDLGDGFYQATWYYEQNGAQAVHTFPRELGYTALVNVETLYASGYAVEPFELFESLRKSQHAGSPALPSSEADAGKDELERRIAALLTVREAAAILHVSKSRVHNRIDQDEKYPPHKRRFPSARPATREEIAALIVAGRLKSGTAKGALVIKRRDVETSSGL